MRQDDHHGMTERLVDALHTESLVLADEARAYFDEHGRGDRDQLAPVDRILFACESLKVTTRLMHVIAWLLAWRSAHSEEAETDAAWPSARRPLASFVESDPDAIAVLPPMARQLIVASRDLHDRVARLEADIARDANPASPARMLIGRLERAL